LPDQGEQQRARRRRQSHDAFKLRVESQRTGVRVGAASEQPAAETESADEDGQNGRGRRR
jgi:hypothetical protein